MKNKIKSIIVVFAIIMYVALSILLLMFYLKAFITMNVIIISIYLVYVLYGYILLASDK